MTYEDVLNDLIQILNDHKMIQTVGYGNLSDLMDPIPSVNKILPNTEAAYSPSKTQAIDYPYAFLNPTNHTLATNTSTYRFNLIMMEQVTDDTYQIIKAQSQCHQYIKDVLAHLYYKYNPKFDFKLNAQVTPFKEKYNDTVSGMTVGFEIQIPDLLEDCITPFSDTPVIQWTKLSKQTITDTGAFEPFTGFSDIMIIPDPIINPDNTWDGTSYVSYIPGLVRYSKIELTFRLKTLPTTGTSLMAPPSLIRLQGGELRAIYNGLVTGWPTEIDNNVHYVTITWTHIPLDGDINGLASYVIASILDISKDECSYDCYEPILTMYI
jgi:hypothetical protein